MSACAVDWPLVLEFTKALAEPLSLVAAAYVAARVGVNAYARQKLLDRKTAWAESVSRRLLNLTRQYGRAARDSSLVRQARLDLDDVQIEVVHGINFVTARWLPAFEAWINAVTADGFDAQPDITPKDVDVLRKHSNRLTAYLMEDLRLAYGVANALSWRERLAEREAEEENDDEGESA